VVLGHQPGTESRGARRRPLNRAPAEGGSAVTAEETAAEIDRRYLTGLDSYNKSTEAYAKQEAAYLKALAEETAANLRSAVALERIVEILKQIAFNGLP
jgi:antirestriction protein ArdC